MNGWGGSGLDADGPPRGAGAGAKLALAGDAVEGDDQAVAMEGQEVAVGFEGVEEFKKVG